MSSERYSAPCSCHAYPQAPCWRNRVGFAVNSLTCRASAGGIICASILLMGLRNMPLRSTVVMCQRCSPYCVCLRHSHLQPVGLWIWTSEESPFLIKLLFWHTHWCSWLYRWALCQFKLGWIDRLGQGYPVACSQWCKRTNRWLYLLLLLEHILEAFPRVFSLLFCLTLILTWNLQMSLFSALS